MKFKMIVLEQMPTVMSRHNFAIPGAVTVIPHATYINFLNTIGILRNVGDIKSGCVGSEFLLRETLD